jgi:hypothetical protein
MHLTHDLVHRSEWTIQDMDGVTISIGTDGNAITISSVSRSVRLNRSQRREFIKAFAEATMKIVDYERRVEQNHAERRNHETV